MSGTIALKSGALRTGQKIHAYGITVLPFLGTVAAILWFEPSALDISLLVAFYLLTILGITVGFHRLLTHRAFNTTDGVRAVLAVLGSMACQGPVIYWVANHRRHHQFSDCPGDPHSPYVDGDRPLKGLAGFRHAHMGWMFTHETTSTTRFAKDLLRDPPISAINRTYLLWVAASLALPALIGGLATLSLSGALSGFVWGGLVRLFLSFHATNAVNSVTHLFGSRPFATSGHSTNNGWLALPVLGEGWHNNHHAFPQSAVFGLRRWQIDLGGLAVVALEKLGLAWNVQRPTAEQIAAKLAALPTGHLAE